MRLRVRPCLMVVAALAALVGCAETDSGPTVAEASQTLKSQIDHVMRQSAALANIRVVEPGQNNVACGGEKVKRMYAATADFHPDDQGLVDELTGALLRQGYKVSEVDAPNSPRTVLRLAAARTMVTIDIPAPGMVKVVGETDCISVQE